MYVLDVKVKLTCLRNRKLSIYGLFICHCYWGNHRVSKHLDHRIPAAAWLVISLPCSTASHRTGATDRYKLARESGATNELNEGKSSLLEGFNFNLKNLFSPLVWKDTTITIRHMHLSQILPHVNKRHNKGELTILGYDNLILEEQHVLLVCLGWKQAISLDINTPCSDDLQLWNIQNTQELHCRPPHWRCFQSVSSKS